jgi:hypothetical protein
MVITICQTDQGRCQHEMPANTHELEATAIQGVKGFLSEKLFEM